MLFLLQERRAAEPVLPLHLFRERIFAVGASVQFFTGASMFVIAIYCPLFLQVVTAQKATESGLLVIPMTIGMLVGSTASGRRLTRTGRYRWYPVVGCALMTAAAILLAAMHRGTDRHRDVGVHAALRRRAQASCSSSCCSACRTASPTRISASRHLRSTSSGRSATRSAPRSSGRSSSRSSTSSSLRLAPASGLRAETLRDSPEQIRQLEPVLRDSVIQSFTNSLHIVFLFTVPFCVIAFVLSWFVPEHPLRASSSLATSTSETD